MQQATSVLKKEHSRGDDICATDSSKQFDVPVFDKSIDYFAKVREQSTLLKQMQGLHEDHSVDFLSMLKESVRAQKRLKTQIEQNEELLVRRKRDEKLNHKELQKMIKLH